VDLSSKDGHVAKKYAAVVLTAVDRLPDNRLSGYWLPEAAYPWLTMVDAGWSVVSISTEVAEPTPGGVDRTDRVQRRFLDDAAIRLALAETQRAEFYEPEDFAAIVFAGGAGAVYDFPEDTALGTFTAAVMADGGVVASSGYGAAGVLAAARVDETVVRGRTVTLTSAAEERALELAGRLPVRLAPALSACGATARFGEAFRPNVIADGPLITGQNPASAPQLAQRVLSAIDGLLSVDETSTR